MLVPSLWLILQMALAKGVAQRERRGTRQDTRAKNGRICIIPSLYYACLETGNFKQQFFVDDDDDDKVI